MTQSRPERALQTAGRALLLLSVATLTLGPRAAAQPSPVDVDTADEPPAEYMQLIGEAVRESVAEHWVEARSLFREAQRVYPNARALRGIGMTSFELRDYTAAHHSLSASLAESRRALDEEQRAQVQALLHRVTELIARYTLAHLGPDAVVLVDAVRQELDADGYVLVPAGSHEVQVTLADGRHVRGSWTVRGGELGPLPIEIPTQDVSPWAAAQAPQPGQLAPPTPLPPSQDHTRERRLGWSLVASAGVLGALGVALTVVGRTDIDLLERPLDDTRWDDVAGLETRGPRFVRTGAALVLLGTASLVAGIVFVLRARPTGDARVQARLLPTGGRLEVSW